MRFPSLPRIFAAVVVLAALGWPAPADAQVAPCPAAREAAARRARPCWSGASSSVAHPVNETIVEQQTYQLSTSRPRPRWPSQNKWAPYDEDAVQADFWNLWRTNFLDNLWIEVIDEPYDNGVMGKHVIFHIEERSRVKVVDYVPAVGTKTEGRDLEDRGQR